jgi:hypothetical protein
MNSIRELLEADHRRLEALLVQAMAPADRIDEPSYQELRSGLLRHIGIEEKILFARARKRLGAPLRLAKRLRIEHGAIASLLVPTPDHALLRELEDLLARHDALEEGDAGVYAECGALLEDEKTSILEEIRNFPAPKLNRHYDGPNVYRTAREALAASARQRFR